MLKDKIILITGSGNGLGAEMAREIANLGAQLILTDINEGDVIDVANAIGEKNSCLSPLTAKHDVTKEDDWKEVYKLIEEKFGKLDGLVNNAGIMIHSPFPMTTVEEFKRTQDINVNSIFIGCQIMLPLLSEAGSANSASSIVNISSVFGQVAGMMHSAYCASKGAVSMLTKSIAVELPRMGMNIRCNSIQPGIMNVGVALSAYGRLVELGIFSSESEAKEILNQTIPLGRPGEAGEIAKAAIFLLSDHASLMTGTEMVLDGGYTAV